MQRLLIMIFLALITGCSKSNEDQSGDGHVQPAIKGSDSKLSSFAPFSKCPAPVCTSLYDVYPVLNACNQVPAELKGLSVEQLEAIWPAWIKRRDTEVRARIYQGEEDSLANYLLYGTSFTRQPRVTNIYQASLLRELGSPQAVNQRIQSILAARAADLANALARPGKDERRLIMLEIATRAGYGTRTSEERNRLAQFAIDNMMRQVNDFRAYTAKVMEAAQTGSTSAANALPNLFETRGLSPDTSILVDYALKQALLEIKKAGLITPDSVRRAGVVGPGLDIIDKSGGYDLYPPQTAQPLMLVDTLLRLELAAKNDLQILTFDINPRVNRHIERAAIMAAAGHAYTINIVHSDEWGWAPEAKRFWEACGSFIGTARDPRPLPGFDGLAVRKIRVRNEWAARIQPMDLNIVYQYAPLEQKEQLDVLIAANVLCYYGPFEQSLSLRNAARMLRPGGILISSDVVTDAGNLDLQRTGTTMVLTTKSEGYTIVWYQKR